MFLGSIETSPKILRNHTVIQQRHFALFLTDEFGLGGFDFGANRFDRVA